MVAAGRDERRGDGVVQVGAGEQARRQLVVIGVVLLLVVVVAVFVGKGRSKSASPPTSTLPATTVPSTTTLETTVSASVQLPAPTTATTEPIVRYAPVSDDPTVVVVATSSGRLLRLDLGAGSAAHLAADSRNIYSVHAVKGGVFYEAGQGSVSFTSFDAGSSPSRVPNAATVIGSPDGQGVVVVLNSRDSRVAFVDGGLNVGADIPLPTGYPVGVVPNGVLIQTNGLGVYRIDLGTGAATRVLGGSFLTTRGDEVAGIVCDPTLHCSIDVVIGGARKYHVAMPTGLSINGGTGAISPDGKRLAYLGVSARGGLIGVVDLATGKAVTIDAPNADERTLGWTTSGNHLIWAQAGALTLWSTHANEDPVKLLSPEMQLSIGDVVAFSAA